MNAQLIKVKYKEEEHLALWKCSHGKSQKNKNVLLTHGTFSNRKVLKGITDFLIEKGFTCWVFEWRNHGDSSKVNEEFNFETIGKEDFKLIFNHLIEVEKIKNWHCITHSGGGICLTIFLLCYPMMQTKIESITLFGCQAFGAANSIYNYSKIWTFKYISKLLGYIPGRKTGSEENEDYHLMKQWFDWNLTGRFCGENGRYYQVEMEQITVPILSVYGAGDTFIAPKSGCEAFLQAFENQENKGLFCSKENAFLEDYDHSRVLHSRNARKEIYPLVLDWINKKSK